MNQNRRMIAALLLTLIMLVVLVATVSAAFLSFSLNERAVYQDGNWVWSGTASITSPVHHICIRFPGSSVGPVSCSGSISGLGSRPFTCTVPVSAFSGVTGNASWSIFANNQSGCTGPQSATPPGNPTTYSGTFIPTAVSLNDFQANPINHVAWWMLLPVIALLFGAGTIFVFKVLKAEHPL